MISGHSIFLTQREDTVLLSSFIVGVDPPRLEAVCALQRGRKASSPEWGGSQEGWQLGSEGPFTTFFDREPDAIDKGVYNMQLEHR